MRHQRIAGARTPARAIATPPGSEAAAPSRRAVLAGGIGAAALIALPLADIPGAAAAAAATGPDVGYAFIYGTPGGAGAGGWLEAAGSPASASSSARARSAATVSLAAGLAAAPAVSPDRSRLALVTVQRVAAGSTVTLALVDTATAQIVRQGTLTLSGLPDGTNILPTPVFAAGSPLVTLVLAVTVPASRQLIRKAVPGTGGTRLVPATTWRSHHQLAYFDQRSGRFSGPYPLSDEPSLALSTAAASGTDLFLWTTAEPQPARSRKGSTTAPLPWISAFPLGSGRPRFSVPAPGPWPGGEPVLALRSGAIARLVNGRDVQVCAARDGAVRQLSIPPLSQARAKPSAVTMAAGPDGTVFITKPGIGKAVLAHPAREFRVTAEVTYPVPASPLGAPWSKAVLSAAGDSVYVLGSASAGGLACYDLASGRLTAAYSAGRQYAGIYQLPGGVLLAVSPANPRLTFFSPSLRPLRTAASAIKVSAVF
jgi:hypothetical protein